MSYAVTAWEIRFDQSDDAPIGVAHATDDRRPVERAGVPPTVRALCGAQVTRGMGVPFGPESDAVAGWAEAICVHCARTAGKYDAVLAGRWHGPGEA